ncbi:hypothetical protein AHiyo8_40990 [Arthrobacter sp. Hiyo8]|nr:hypothetical protein AHiyo8_40990 [Arthrobacter sp. Hiyo8]
MTKSRSSCDSPPSKGASVMRLAGAETPGKCPSPGPVKNNPCAGRPIKPKAAGSRASPPKVTDGDSCSPSSGRLRSSPTTAGSAAMRTGSVPPEWMSETPTFEASASRLHRFLPANSLSSIHMLEVSCR